MFQEVNFGIGEIALTKGRSNVVDFMTPFYEYSATFMIKVPDENKLWIYLKIFKVSNFLHYFIIILFWKSYARFSLLILVSLVI